MVNTIVDGTFRQTNLTNESSEYLGKREELRLAEIELMRQRERVAELRRHLPQGAPIQDYAFERARATSTVVMRPSPCRWELPRVPMFQYTLTVRCCAQKREEKTTPRTQAWLPLSKESSPSAPNLPYRKSPGSGSFRRIHIYE